MWDNIGSPFDYIAEKYDEDFSNSLAGTLQRNRVWHFLKEEIKAQKPLHVLEINCGTGVDAIWMTEHNCEVWATDVSANMITIAKSKLRDNSAVNCHFSICSFNQLEKRFEGRKFDLIFSNFAGLNCVDENEIRKLNTAFFKLLNENGRLTMVLLGKNCLTERFYFALKNEFKNANRRYSVALAKLTKDVLQPTWYYHSLKLTKLFSSFVLIRKRPIGLFIPPSYLNLWLNKHPVITKLATWLEYTIGSLPIFADNGDHIYLSMSKKITAK
jgi:ubiquinone/menaquinone biosynthesis C-methylase UbiE